MEANVFRFRSNTHPTHDPVLYSDYQLFLCRTFYFLAGLTSWLAAARPAENIHDRRHSTHGAGEG